MRHAEQELLARRDEQREGQVVQRLPVAPGLPPGLNGATELDAALIGGGSWLAGCRVDGRRQAAALVADARDAVAQTDAAFKAGVRAQVRNAGLLGIGRHQVVDQAAVTHIATSAAGAAPAPQGEGVQSDRLTGQVGVGKARAVEQADMHPRLKACRPGLLQQGKVRVAGHDAPKLGPKALGHAFDALPGFVRKAAAPGVKARQQLMQLNLKRGQLVT